MSKTLTVKTSKTQIKAAEENKTVKAVSKKVNQINENIDVKIYSVEGKIVETLPLAQQMQEQNINKENIKRAILYEQRLIIQPQGRDPMAGMRCSSEMHTRQRRTYRSKKNKGMTRVARNPFTMEGVQTTNARGGSHRHKPRAEKRVEWTLPKKEYLKAMRAALTLSTRVDEVVARGHKLDKEVKLPIVFDASLFDIKKTKNFVEFLKQAGFEEELARAQNRIIKAGKGKIRGRKYKEKKSILVISEKPMIACENIPGVENYSTDELMVQDVFPGANHPRLIVWCVDSYKKLIGENVYGL